MPSPLNNDFTCNVGATDAATHENKMRSNCKNTIIPAILCFISGNDNLPKI